MPREDGTMGERDTSLGEKRLRAMVASAYALDDPPPKTSESLRRRVALLAAGHDCQTAPAARRPRPLGSAPAAILQRFTIGLSFAFAALALILWSRHHGAAIHMPRAAAPSLAATPGRRSAPLVSRSERPRAEIPRPIPGTLNRAVRHAPSLQALAVRREAEGAATPAAPTPPAMTPGDDLAFLNARPESLIRQWAPLSEDERNAIEARVRRIVQVRDDFVRIPFPRIASTSDRQIAAAVESYKRQAAIGDAHLSREVTLQLKATALADLCDHLRTDTGVHLSAGASVADEKVTIFCKKMPLREVMRQLSRPFGYTWLRSKRAGEFRYELIQDLHSQLLEEELRNRDRNAALLALDREMERYRPYLSLSWGDVQERAKSAPPDQKKILEQLSSGWGMVQMYFRLTPADLKALRSEEKLTFSTEPAPGQRLMPADQARVMIDSFRRVGALGPSSPARSGPGATVPADPSLGPQRDVAEVTVWIRQSELGQFSYGGFFGVDHLPPPPVPIPGAAGSRQGADRLAVGESPAVRSPDNAAANARLVGDPALQPPVTIRPRSSCHVPDAGTSPSAGPSSRAEPKVSSADVLEAVFQATGIPIVADYYTRLYEPGPLTAQKRRLFDALNQVADAMHMRWAKDRGWLEFRSASFYDDRLKEVPSRLLTRWSEARRRRGMLSLDDLTEIAQLSDAQLDAAALAEGARECWGLSEWDLVRNAHLRPYWRYLAGCTPEQRQEAASAAGLLFSRMSRPQQQQFLAFTYGTQSNAQKLNLEELAQAAFQVRYTPQGWYEWTPKGSRPDPDEIPAVRERTAEAALQAARRLDPQATRDQITRTEPAAVIQSIVGPPNHRYGANFAWVTPHSEMYGGP